MISNHFASTAFIDLADPYNDIRSEISRLKSNPNPDKAALELLDTVVAYTLNIQTEEECQQFLKDIKRMVGDSDQMIMHDVDRRIMAHIGNLPAEVIETTQHSVEYFGLTTLVIPKQIE